MSRPLLAWAQVLTSGFGLHAGCPAYLYKKKKKKMHCIVWSIVSTQQLLVIILTLDLPTIWDSVLSFAEEETGHPGSLWLLPALTIYFFFKDFIYLFMRKRERDGETETQAEGEAGSLRGARCRTRSRDPGVTPWGPRQVLNR